MFDWHPAKDIAVGCTHFGGDVGFVAAPAHDARRGFPEIICNPPSGPRRDGVRADLPRASFSRRFPPDC